MSSVCETRYGQNLQQVEEFAERLGGAKPLAPAVLDEWTLRLLATVLILLRQHHVNERGQCRFCGWTTGKWRFWRRRRCTVYAALDYTMRQSLDVVWWKVLGELGRNVSLEDYRHGLIAEILQGNGEIRHEIGGEGERSRDEPAPTGGEPDTPMVSARRKAMASFACEVKYIAGGQRTP